MKVTAEHIYLRSTTGCFESFNKQSKMWLLRDRLWLTTESICEINALLSKMHSCKRGWGFLRDFTGFETNKFTKHKGKLWEFIQESHPCSPGWCHFLSVPLLLDVSLTPTQTVSCVNMFKMST